MVLTLTLKRTNYRDDGIFSQLLNSDGSIVAFCLDHSYDGVPKLYPGTFTCVRGMHRLEGMAAPFETFEITGVEGHTDILFHVGNYNRDSAGCVLLGHSISSEPSGWMLRESRSAFDQFMSMLSGIDEFDLVVVA